MTEYTFTIPGPPQGKQRPRFVRSGFPYTPPETTDYENLVRQVYIRAVGHRQLPTTQRTQLFQHRSSTGIQLSVR